MQTITSHAQASMAMTGFLVDPGSGLPDGLLTAVRAKMVGSPVDQYVGISEMLFSAKALLNNNARDLCGALASFCADNGWHGMGDRGLAIKKAMQRDMGEPAPASGWPAQSADPPAMMQYLFVEQPSASTDDQQAS